MQKIKRIPRDERPEQRIRPVVLRKLLLDEKAKLVKRVKQIDRELQTA